MVQGNSLHWYLIAQLNPNVLNRLSSLAAASSQAATFVAAVVVVSISVVENANQNIQKNLVNTTLSR